MQDFFHYTPLIYFCKALLHHNVQKGVTFLHIFFSFADIKCSGKVSCLLRLAELVYHEIKPCPMELPPYLEAGYTCYNGITIG